MSFKNYRAITLIVTCLLPITAPLFGILQAGSQGDNGLTVIGITNANSPLYFPFMGYTYTSRMCILSECWTGLTNGVIHWRGDGANPGTVCVAPREFWFQTNWNWIISANALGRIVFSNDTGILNEGTIAVSVDLISAWYTNTSTGPASSGDGFVHYDGIVGVSNGLISSAANFAPSGTVNSPLDTSLFIQTNSNGSFLIVATNYPGQVSGYNGGFADYVIIHCRELTTGTNWPIH